jgi:hypothetical protein
MLPLLLLPQLPLLLPCTNSVALLSAGLDKAGLSAACCDIFERLQQQIVCRLL